MESTEFLQKKRTAAPSPPPPQKAPDRRPMPRSSPPAPTPTPTPVGAALAATQPQPPRGSSLPAQAPPAIQPPVATYRSLLQPLPTRGPGRGGALRRDPTPATPREPPAPASLTSNSAPNRDRRSLLQPKIQRPRRRDLGRDPTTCRFRHLEAHPRDLHQLVKRDRQRPARLHRLHKGRGTGARPAPTAA